MEGTRAGVWEIPANGGCIWVYGYHDFESRGLESLTRFTCQFECNRVK